MKGKTSLSLKKTSLISIHFRLSKSHTVNINQVNSNRSKYYHQSYFAKSTYHQYIQFHPTITGFCRKNIQKYAYF